MFKWFKKKRDGVEIDFDFALKVAKQIWRRGSYRSSALKEIAVEMVKVGDVDRALEVAEEIWDKEKCSEALWWMASRLVKVGDVDRAKNLLKRASEVAERIDDEKKRSSALEEIAVEMVKVGDVDRAKNLLKRASKVAEQTEKLSSLKDIAVSIAKVSAIPKLREKAEKLERAGKLDEAIKIYEETGEYKKAEELRIKKEIEELIAKYPNLSEDVKLEIERFKRGDLSVDVYKLLEELRRRITKYEKIKEIESHLELHHYVKFPDKIFNVIEDFKNGKYDANVEELRKLVDETIDKYEKAKLEVENLKREIEGIEFEELKEPVKLFEEGKYKKCLEAVEEAREKLKRAKQLIKTLNDLKLKVESAKDVTVPETLDLNVKADTIEEFERTVESLSEEINSILSSKPKIKVKILDKIIKTDWNPFKIEITNKSYAHAYNLTVSLRGEIETLAVKPATVKGMQTATFEIPIKPREPGKIPLEITVIYRGSKGEEYRDVISPVWIDVVEGEEKTSEKLSKPATPETYPSELAEVSFPAKIPVKIDIKAPAEIKWNSCGILRVEVTPDFSIEGLTLELSDLVRFFKVLRDRKPVTSIDFPPLRKGIKIVEEIELIPKYKGTFKAELTF